MEFDSVQASYEWMRQGNPWASDDRLLQDAQDKLRQLDSGKWTWRADAQLFNTPLPDMTDPGLIGRYWDAIDTIMCPILEVRGAASPLVSDEILDSMKSRGHDLTSVDVADAGHVVTVDKPQEFINAVSAYLGVETAQTA
jgi:pimeloyl-ACP methyl ester carboxylesterase